MADSMLGQRRPLLGLVPGPYRGHQGLDGRHEAGNLGQYWGIVQDVDVLFVTSLIRCWAGGKEEDQYGGGRRGVWNAPGGRGEDMG